MRTKKSKSLLQRKTSRITTEMIEIEVIVVTEVIEEVEEIEEVEAIEEIEGIEEVTEVIEEKEDNVEIEVKEVKEVEEADMIITENGHLVETTIETRMVKRKSMSTSKLEKHLQTSKTFSKKIYS